MTQKGDIYGRGLKFPPQIGANGQMLWSEGEDNVRESLSIILRTQPGERVRLPEFGCDLEQFLFEPNTLATLALIQREIRRALTRWEPRVNIDDVMVESRLWNSRTLVDITVFYTLVATQTQQTIQTTFALQG
jgi:phage baseplate assembly protein W